jgi:uncharacterized repeat protein (TIGR03803 family)
MWPATCTGVGTIYRVGVDGSHIVLHSFDYGTEGGFPLGALLLDRANTLYGVTSTGGPLSEGTVFKLTPQGVFTVLHSFSFTDGQGYLPTSLASSPNGDLYGTTSSGGPLGGVVVFRLAADGTYTLLFSFVGGLSDANGASPFGLTPVAGGAYVGLTQSGGTDQQGTIFKIASDGTFTLLQALPAYPSGRLAQDGAGNFYGFSLQGGTAGFGSVYRLASGGAFDVLYSFSGGSDGLFPHLQPLLDGGGNIYGMTSNGGLEAGGTVFRLAPNGALKVIHDLRITYLNGGLALGPGGDLFGTTQRAGAGSGSLFQLSTVDGAFQELFSFGGPDGDFPAAGPVLDGAGRLFGTTSYGGSVGGGIVFRLESDHTFALLHDFGVDPGPPMDGRTPLAGLRLDGLGNLYGTTQSGGDFFQGTVFTSTVDGGSYAPVHVFGSVPDDGGAPVAAVTLDGSGHVFGAASQGGSGGQGIIFKAGPGPAYSILHAFSGPDGSTPSGAVAVDASGNVYGTTLQGGASNFGNVFKIARDGTFTVLHEFNGADGASPQGSILLDSGTLYGTTAGGGATGRGTVFGLGTDGGRYTVLHNFHGPDGSFPLGGLVLDGNVLYGTASAGGPLSGGVLFQVDLP